MTKESARSKRGATTAPPPNAADASESGAGLPARRAALDLLRQVLGRKRPLDEVLAEQFAGSGGLAALAPRDRAFARLLVATCLRRLGQIDALLAHCLETPLPTSAAVVRDILRLGTAQLVFLGTPAHAAVHQGVTLVEQAGAPRFKSLANAVLRRLAREGAALVEAQEAVGDAARLNTPDWLWRSWSRAYGEKTCRAIAEAHLGEPPLDIAVPKDADRWAGLLQADMLPTGTLRRTAGGAVGELPGYDEGAWWVQDAAAALPARLLGDVAGKSVVDLCAAPGGKTAQLAAAGARVTAVDRSAARLARLSENLGRLGLAAETVVADVTEWRPAEPVDAVLLDAPCSATGTIRRHPDIPHLKNPTDVVRLAAVQDRLLAAAVEMLAPGGVLVFCTCSLEPEEGSERVAALLAGGAPLDRRPIRPAEIGGLAELLTDDGDLRTLPCHLADRGGMDGFYAARLVRR